MGRPLRICFFGRTMPAHRGGKGMFHPFLVASALAQRGHDLTILTTSHARMTEESPHPGLHILYLPGTPSDQYSDEYWQASTMVFDRLHGLSPFDAVWSDSAGAAGWSRLSASRFEVPLIAVCHAGLGMIAHDRARDFFATTHHDMLRSAAAIVCVSRTVAESIAAGLPRSADKIRIVPNGADPGVFRVSPADVVSLRRELKLDARPVLLYLGRVVPEKGGETLVRAVATLAEPRPQLLIVGPGPHATELRTLAATLDVPLTLVPGVEHHQTPRYLSVADLFILPTHHFEGLPFTLIEAMFCRRPIIACDIGGVSEIIRHEHTGLLTLPRNPVALAAAITRLLADRRLRESLAAAGYKHARRCYSLEAMIDSTETLLRETCAAGSICA